MKKWLAMIVIILISSTLVMGQIATSEEEAEPKWVSPRDKIFEFPPRISRLGQPITYTTSIHYSDYVDSLVKKIKADVSYVGSKAILVKKIKADVFWSYYFYEEDIILACWSIDLKLRVGSKVKSGDTFNPENLPVWIKVIEVGEDGRFKVKVWTAY